jgi:hypothetical protein
MIAARMLLDPSIRERWLEPLVNHGIIDGDVAIKGMLTCQPATLSLTFEAIEYEDEVMCYCKQLPEYVSRQSLRLLISFLIEL